MWAVNGSMGAGDEIFSRRTVVSDRVAGQREALERMERNVPPL